MDLRATTKLATPSGPETYDIPFEVWACYIGKTKIIKQWHLRLQEHTNGKFLHKFWHMQKRFGEGTADQMDWELIHWAMLGVRWS